MDDFHLIGIVVLSNHPLMVEWLKKKYCAVRQLLFCWKCIHVHVYLHKTSIIDTIEICMRHNTYTLYVQSHTHYNVCPSYNTHAYTYSVTSQTYFPQVSMRAQNVGTRQRYDWLERLSYTFSNFRAVYHKLSVCIHRTHAIHTCDGKVQMI